MQKETVGFGDHAVATMQANVTIPEVVNLEGHYHVVCRDKDGNVKWEEGFPNLVVGVGKQYMFDSILKTAVSVVGPYLGLIGSVYTPAATDTMTTIAAIEFTAYTGNRQTAVFAAASGTTTTTSTAAALTYNINGSGTVYGCFLLTGAAALVTKSNALGVLYSGGNFGTAKAVTNGDTVAVTYSTTAS